MYLLGVVLVIRRPQAKINGRPFSILPNAIIASVQNLEGALLLFTFNLATEPTDGPKGEYQLKNLG